MHPQIPSTRTRLTDCLTDIVVDMTPLARVILLLSVLVAESFRRPGWSARQRLPTTTQAIPRDLVFDASQIEIIRVLGKIDVMEIASGRKIRTIDVPGVRVVASYWRQ